MYWIAYISTQFFWFKKIIISSLLQLFYKSLSREMEQTDAVYSETRFEGFLFGHSGPVTSIVTGNAQNTDTDDAILVSGSRDKTLIIWNLAEKFEDDRVYGQPKKCLTGHNHFVTDLAISNCNSFVLSSSWDKTLRLWDIRNNGSCKKIFFGHTQEVHSTCFSSNNRQVFSGSSENTLKLWNILGECKATSENHNHHSWVTRVRYSNVPKNPYYASVGRDGRLKLWSGIFKIYASITAHDAAINALALSTNGQYIATGGGTDNSVKIWNYAELSKPHLEFKNECQVNDIAFNDRYQWIAVAYDNGFKVVSLQNKEDHSSVISIEPVDSEDKTEDGEPKKVKKLPKCTSVAWSSNARKLYIGCSDGVIRVYSVNAESSQ